jgi:hypothetical protein
MAFKSFCRVFYYLVHGSKEHYMQVVQPNLQSNLQISEGGTIRVRYVCSRVFFRIYRQDQSYGKCAQ